MCRSRANRGRAVMSNNADSYSDPQPHSSHGAQDASAAARLLEITARETDQWRADARSEAASIVAAARTESDGLVRAAREEAERLVSAAQEEAARTTNDARVEAYRVREETSAVRRRHDEDIARLE